MKIPGDVCKGGFEPNRVEKKIKRNCPEEEEFKEEFGMAGSDSWHDYIDIADLFNTDGLFERNSESEKVTQNHSRVTLWPHKLSIVRLYWCVTTFRSCPRIHGSLDTRPTFSSRKEI